MFFFGKSLLQQIPWGRMDLNFDLRISFSNGRKPPPTFGFFLGGFFCWDDFWKLEPEVVRYL